MANCPACGHKLKLTDISQFCPACGVNMRFVNFEENFYLEAKYAELSQAAIKVKFKRFKAAFIGSRLTIIRLIVAFLPILALLIPNGNIHITLPFFEQKIPFSILGLVTLFSGGDFGYITGQSGEVFAAARTAIYAYIAVAALAVLTLLLSLLCFLSVKNMQKVISVFAGISAAVSIAAMFLIPTKESLTISIKSGFALCAAVLAFAVVFTVNILLDKKGIPVEYGEGMEERARLYKEYKAGRLDLDQLPQPIVETAETRKILEEIAQEQEDYRKAHEKEAN